jgi:predicted transcriptional regulator
MSRNRKPTDAELEILQVLWRQGPSTVRQVNEALNRERNVGYTTTLKMMQLMAEKEMLSRDETRRSHLYAPLVQESDAQNLLVDKLVKSAFGGSAVKLVVSALGNVKTSEKELEKIRALLDDIEARKGGNP